jgi:hypothetical protein
MNLDKYTQKSQKALLAAQRPTCFVPAFGCDIEMGIRTCGCSKTITRLVPKKTSRADYRNWRILNLIFRLGMTILIVSVASLYFPLNQKLTGGFVLIICRLSRFEYSHMHK